MLDVAPTELLLVGFVALVVIGPKDLPKTLRVVGQWVGRARGVARQFRSGFDTMVREAELEEMEKRWAEENARIMKEHGAGTSAGTADAHPEHATPTGDAASHDAAPHDPFGVDPDTDAATYVEKPYVAPAPMPDPVTGKPEGAS